MKIYRDLCCIMMVLLVLCAALSIKLHSMASAQKNSACIDQCFITELGDLSEESKENVEGLEQELKYISSNVIMPKGELIETNVPVNFNGSKWFIVCTLPPGQGPPKVA